MDEHGAGLSSRLSGKAFVVANAGLELSNVLWIFSQYEAEDKAL
jgi:hypothetical protein